MDKHIEFHTCIFVRLFQDIVIEWPAKWEDQSGCHFPIGRATRLPTPTRPSRQHSTPAVVPTRRAFLRQRQGSISMLHEAAISFTSHQICHSISISEGFPPRWPCRSSASSQMKSVPVLQYICHRQRASTAAATRAKPQIGMWRLARTDE